MDLTTTTLSSAPNTNIASNNMYVQVVVDGEPLFAKCVYLVNGSIFGGADAIATGALSAIPDLNEGQNNCMLEVVNTQRPLFAQAVFGSV